MVNNIPHNKREDSVGFQLSRLTFASTVSYRLKIGVNEDHFQFFTSILNNLQRHNTARLTDIHTASTRLPPTAPRRGPKMASSSHVIALSQSEAEA